MIIARFRQSRYLVRESDVFIKDKTKVASSEDVYSGQLSWESTEKKFCFRGVESQKISSR